MNSIMERWIKAAAPELLSRTLIYNQDHLLHEVNVTMIRDGSANSNHTPQRSSPPAAPPPPPDRRAPPIHGT